MTGESMKPERWARLQQLYLDTLELPEGEREAFLRAADVDDKLREEVLELLQADGSVDPLLESSLDDLVGLIEEEEHRAPERAGPYRILGVLGHGGMGAVYRAEREAVDRTVALKLLAGWLTDPVSTARFEREQRILARLEHPNIARLYDAGVTEEGRPFLGMELVEGEPIHQYCDGRQLGVTERLRLFEQVCEAVEYAHRRLIVHRDLKPSNILVTEDGRVKLLDFGIAKLLEAPGDDPSEPLTRNTRILTPEYASPEQLLGEELSTASDVYSLGVVLHRLLTGRYPRREDGRTITRAPSELATRSAGEEGGDPDAVAAARGTTPRELSRKLQGDIDTILLKVMRFEPEERYASVAALRDDLVRLREGHPIAARAPSTAYRVNKFVRRNRVGVAAAAILALVMSGSAWALFQAERRATESAQRAEVEARTASRAAEFLADVFASAAPEIAQGEEVSIREALDAAAERLPTELVDEPRVQVRLYQNIGQIYDQLGLVEEARAQYELAMPLLESTPDLAWEARFGLIRAKAINHVNRSELDGAVEGLTEALSILDANGGGTPFERSELLSNLGLTHINAGRTEEAEETLLEAIAIDSAALVNDTSFTLGRNLNHLGLVYYSLGRAEEAVDLFQQALDVRRRTLGDTHPQVVESMTNVGTILGLLGRPEEGEPYLRESLELNRRLYGEEHWYIANDLRQIAANLQQQGRADEALPVGESALDMFRRTLGPEHPRVGLAHSALGNIALDLGDTLSTANHLQAAQDIFLAAFGDWHEYSAGMSVRLAQVRLWIEADTAAAVGPIEHGLSWYHEVQGPSAQHTVRTREVLVELYESWGRPDEAARILDTYGDPERRASGQASGPG